MKHQVIMLGMLGLFVMGSGCATVGKDFNVFAVPKIQIGTTTQDDIKEMFGSPWRTGMEDGFPTWTYGRYHYSIFSPAQTQDLVIRFNAQGIVTSYTYNTTEHEE